MNPMNPIYHRFDIRFKYNTRSGRIRSIEFVRIGRGKTWHLMADNEQRTRCDLISRDIQSVLLAMNIPSPICKSCVVGAKSEKPR